MNVQVSGSGSSANGVSVETYDLGQQASEHPSAPGVQDQDPRLTGASASFRQALSWAPDTGNAVLSGTSALDVVPIPQAPEKVSTQVSQEAQPYLNPDFAAFANTLSSIAINAANRSQVAITSIRIDLKYLRKDRRRNPHIWMEIVTDPDVHPNQALALWDSIGLDIDRWTPKLSAKAKRLFDDRFALSVVWVEPDAGHP